LVPFFSVLKARREVNKLPLHGKLFRVSRYFCDPHVFGHAAKPSARSTAMASG
jgi:hypothetical protein